MTYSYYSLALLESIPEVLTIAEHTRLSTISPSIFHRPCFLLSLIFHHVTKELLPMECYDSKR